MMTPSATGPVTRSRTRGRGPMTSLPTELVLAILQHILDQYITILERQKASQLFLRVNRAFRSAYLLSEAAHDCALTSTDKAANLIAQLSEFNPSIGPMRSLGLNLHEPKFRMEDRTSPVVGRLVGASGGELRRFVWKDNDRSPRWHIKPELVDVWEQCTQLQELEVDFGWDSIRGRQLERLLAAWPKLSRLHLVNLLLDFDRREPFATAPPAEWTVSSHLRSLHLLVLDRPASELLANILRASTHTLTHLYLEYGRDPDWSETEQAMIPAFGPVANTMTSFTCHVGGNSPGPFDLIASILGTLTNLTFIDIPLDVAPLPQLAAELHGHRPLEVLNLYDRDACGSAEWDELLALLDQVEVGHVGVSSHCWDDLHEWHWVEMEGGLSEEEEEELTEEMGRLKGLVEARGKTFEWLEWRDTR